MIESPFGIEYELRVPNKEVQISLNALFINYLTGEIRDDVRRGIYYSLERGELEEFKDSLITLFSSIPYNNYINNNIAKYEGYWASLVYCYLAGSALKIIAEDVTNRGRIDLTIKVNSNIYILEFKITNDDPLKQIKEKKYYEKYLNENKNIYLIGITFDEESKNIKEFVWKKVKNIKNDKRNNL
jgi:hypothetical protein